MTKLTKEEIEALAVTIGNLCGTLGMSCPNDVRNAGLYFGAKIALQTLFPEQEINELIKIRKKEFEELKK